MYNRVIDHLLMTQHTEVHIQTQTRLFKRPLLDAISTVRPRWSMTTTTPNVLSGRAFSTIVRDDWTVQPGPKLRQIENKRKAFGHGVLDVALQQGKFRASACLPGSTTFLTLLR